MTKEDDLQAVIDLIYEAVLDDTLWPKSADETCRRHGDGADRLAQLGPSRPYI